MNEAEQRRLLPYLPKDRKIIYISPANRFMGEATKMLVGSGCVKQPTAAVIVKKGKIIGRGVNAGKRVDVCPRVLNTGNNPKNASMYLDGHWWVCKPCWDEIIKAGIIRIFLRKDAIKLYKK